MSQGRQSRRLSQSHLRPTARSMSRTPGVWSTSCSRKQSCRATDRVRTGDFFRSVPKPTSRGTCASSLNRTPPARFVFPNPSTPLGRNRTFSELTHFFGIKGRNRNHLCPGLKSAGFMLRGPRLRHSTRPDPPTLATNSPAAVADMDGITRQGLPTVRSGGEARSSRSNKCSLAIGMVGPAPVNQVFRLAPVARRQAGRR